MKSFTSFLAEAAGKEIYFTFGRFSPPTIGHGKLLDATAALARGGKQYRIYASHTQDAKKNPLDYTDKIKFMRKMFPRHARNIIQDNEASTALVILSKLYAEGFTAVTMVVGGDRVDEFKALLNKYNGVKGPNGFYNFQGGVGVDSAGERDPDAEGVVGMSASKMRQAAAANDLASFARGLPSDFKEVEDLFQAVREGMGLSESALPRRYVPLESTGSNREAYLNGDIFALGEQAIVKESGEVGTVTHRGANYLIVETASNKKRYWLDALEAISEQTNLSEDGASKGWASEAYTSLVGKTKSTPIRWIYKHYTDEPEVMTKPKDILAVLTNLDKLDAKYSREFKVFKNLNGEITFNQIGWTPDYHLTP